MLHRKLAFSHKRYDSNIQHLMIIKVFFYIHFNIWSKNYIDYLIGEEKSSICQEKKNIFWTKHAITK